MSTRRGFRPLILETFWTRVIAVGCGAVSAFLVLVPTYTSLGERYPEWVPLIGWALGPFIAAVGLSRRYPDNAWGLAAFIEAGVILGIIFDIQLRTQLGIPSTLWPVAIALVTVVSLPSVLVGTLLGRERVKFRRQRV